MIRFGTSPIAWSNDDDRRLGAGISLEQCLEEAASIGFEGIERGHKFPTDPELLRSILAHHDLRLISGWTSLDLLATSVEQVIATIEPELRLLQAMGCDICVVAETSNATHGRNLPLNDRPRLLDSEWTQFGENLDRVARHVGDRGMALAYHHHVGTIVETEEEIDRLMEVTGPETNLLLDTGHCLLGGGDPATVCDRHKSRVRHLHFKDVRKSVLSRFDRGSESFLDAVRAGIFTVPGDPDGCVDFERVLHITRSAGYRGWVVVEAEQDPEKHPPASAQSLGLETLKAVVRRLEVQG